MVTVCSDGVDVRKFRLFVVAASHHGNTPDTGKLATSVPVTPYTTSVGVNLGAAFCDERSRLGVDIA